MSPDDFRDETLQGKYMTSLVWIFYGICWDSLNLYWRRMRL